MEQINMEKFGAFVAVLRKEKGLTQKELGELLFVTDKTVSKWERGLSLPSVSLLLPLSEVLGVTVTELLRGERTQTESLSVAEVEQLLTQSLALSSGDPEQRRRQRRTWVKAYALCLVVSVLEIFGLRAAGCSWEHMSSSVFLVVLMMLIFAGWFCFAAPDTLPAYYDQNRISYYTDGIFRIHMAGMRFNNRNWPHIVRVCRRCCLGTAVLFPAVYFLFELAGLNRQFLPSLGLTLTGSLGIIAPIYMTGKKYE